MSPMRPCLEMLCGKPESIGEGLWGFVKIGNDLSWSL
jgi:hypothetical protein